MATARITGEEGVVEVTGEIDLVPLARSSAHDLDAGVATYKCPHCDDDHPIAFVVERNAQTGEEGGISVGDDGEAWAVAEYLLVEAFGLVSPGTWIAMKAMAAIEAADAEENPYGKEAMN